MKKFISIIWFTGIALLLASCSSDLDTQQVIAQGAIDEIKVNTTAPFVCTADNLNEIAYIFTWTEADFGDHVSASYTLEFDLKGNEFKSPVDLVVGTKLTKELISSELNGIMHRLNQPIETDVDLEVRVVGSPIVLGSSKPANLPKVNSKISQSVIVQSYAMPAIHIVGDMFNSSVWDIANYKFVMMRDNILDKDQCTTYFKDNSSFKVVENARLGDWSLTYGKSGNGTLSSKGGNISDIKEAGYYTLLIDFTKMTYAITPYDASAAKTYSEVTVSGSALNEKTVLKATSHDPHMWEADNVELKEGEAILQGNDNSNWGATSFPYGKASLGGEKIVVSKAGTYYIKFSDLTGHYIFYKKK